MSADEAAIRRRAVVSAVIGGFFELFDFSLFGFFAASIGRNFFPSSDPVVSMLSSLATFGAGFIMRPVGGLVIGALADRYGRKSALVFTLLSMALATGATGLVPGYASIGPAAAVLLVLLRLLQGFSAGGEWGGSAVFLVEFAPPGRRGFFGSWQQFGLALGSLGGSFAAFLVAATLPPAAVDEWGWRIPFLAGVLLAPVGYFLRRRVGETPVYKQAAAERRTTARPLRATGRHWRAVLIVAGATMVWSGAGYTFSTFVPSYAAVSLHLSAAMALGVNTAAAAIRIALTPPMGALSDRIGRKPLVFAMAAGFLLLSYPMFAWLAAAPGLGRLLAVQAVAAVLMAVFSGPGPAMLCELFPPAVRTTGVSVGYNLVTAVFGGFAPFACTALVHLTGQAAAPSYFVIGCAAVSLAAIAVIPGRLGQASVSPAAGPHSA